MGWRSIFNFPRLSCSYKLDLWMQEIAKYTRMKTSSISFEAILEMLYQKQ